VGSTPAMIWAESNRNSYEKLPAEELYARVSIILKEQLGDKQYLLRLIREGLSLSIPRNYTYKEIIEKIVKLGKEKEFCGLFQSRDFIEMIMLYRKMLILDFFTNDELRMIGQELCKASYDPSSRSSMIGSISKNVTEEKIISLFIKTNAQKQEKHLVQQHKRWIIGSLGLLRSNQSRSWFNAIELNEVLENHLNHSDQFAYFFARLKEEQGFNRKESVNDPFYKSNGIQLILASFNDDLIIEILNNLADKGILEIDSVKKSESLIVSPYGIFREEYFGYDNLVNLILESFSDEEGVLDSELRSEGLARGSVELRVREKCLKKNPREIIETFFGTGPNLIKLARRIGLVSLRRIRDKEDLLRVILLKLGFTFPPKLDGLLSYSNELKRHRAQLEAGVDDELRRGLWNKVYSETERILRDLILFFFSCLWQSRLREYYKNDVKGAKLKEMIRAEFGLRKSVDILTLGDLCDLLSHINKKIQSNSSLRRDVESIFKRTCIVPSKHLEKLEYVRSARTVLTGIHPTKKKDADPMMTFLKLLEISEDWLSLSKQGRIFPLLIRVKEEKTNEFGISHSIAIDEKGDQWTLKKSGMWIRPEYAYYMLSDTELVAIEPILVEKIW
jgi:hypothetical protein